ncbi:MAG: FHA domain-containing protein FhaB/FipA [Propionibacteriaceae bacterium]
MSTLAIAALKIGFLILLWLFVLIVARAIRTDIKAPTSEAREQGIPTPSRAKTKHPKKGAPRILRVTEGRQQGLEFPLTKPITIGRDASSMFVLDDDYASTRHATVAADGNGGYYVEDHSSTNGSYINGVRITQPTALGTADELRIGHTAMRLIP